MPAPTQAPGPSAPVRRLQRGLSLRANSMLITLFGDAIAPRQQSVWLGSLIRLAEPFGLSDRLVRTSTFRLVSGGWLQAQRVGRRSYYGLSPEGLRRVAHADRRIYEFNLPSWDGHWTLVLLPAGLRASQRARLQRELLWESYGRMAPNVFAHPHAAMDTLHDILDAQGLRGQVAVLRAQSLDDAGSLRPTGPGPASHARPEGAAGPDALQLLMRQTFSLGQVELAWDSFIRRFQPLEDQAAELGGADAFMARTLLIHEYRRVLLRDPNLPEALLPTQWPGVRARALCESLYHALLPASESWLRQQVQTLDGVLAPMPEPRYEARAQPDQRPHAP